MFQWLPKQKFITLEWENNITHFRKAEFENGPDESVLAYYNYSLSYYSVIGPAAVWSYSCPVENGEEGHGEK